jgi:localization factor PodJL
MTTESDLSAGTPGQRPPKAGKKQASSSEPPAIQINMPKQGARRKAVGQPRAQSTSMDKVEGLLGKLMGRLDDNDQRYTNALFDLNKRLNELSERAQSASGTHSSSAGATLDRVREQASSLAAQVNEAGTAYRTEHGAPLPNLEQRMGGFSSANDDGPNPSLGDARLNDDFAEVTQRLERSLAARAPASDFDTLTHRMDDLSHRFDSALSAKDDLAALQTIESHLNSLTAGFSEAQQNYTRVEAIEGHLVSLMNWAQSSGAPGNGSDSKRLNAIEQTLHALNENAREMDARTAGTLEAMNEALHSLAANTGTDDAPHEYHDDAAMEASDEEPPQAAAAQPSPEDYAEVWIDEQPEQEDTPREPAREAAPAADRLGATIPDYQPPPDKPRGDGKATRHEKPQERVEPTFESENDFIASARRAAAAAAAQEPAPRPAKSSRRSSKRMAGIPGDAFSSEGKRPRSLLVYAAVGLLLVSAGLLYARLNSPSHAPVTGTSQIPTPQSPVLVPNQAPDNEANPITPAPKAPGEKHSERILNAPATPPQMPATRTSQQVPASAPAPRPAATVMPAAQPISTATLLASLPPNAGQQLMPGVSVEIKESATRAPAPLSGTAPHAAVPALVPLAPTTPRQVLIPLPKRAPAPSAISRATPANTNPVDSARANEVTPAAGKQQTRMPPARIGPHSLRIAAVRGNPAAQIEIASRYAKGTGVPKNLKKAAEWYQRAAAAGFAPGQYRLAALYERGQGVKKDAGMARTWYRRAAELGNVRAMHNLAVLYTRSDTRAADYASAKNWFYEAARHGLADSQFNLGILYESGLGTKKNTAEAYKWFTLAARQGDAEARKRREALRPQLPARSLSAAEKTIRRWKPAVVKDAANRTGPPRGGWQNAKSKKNQGAGDPAIIARTQFLLNKLGYDAGVPDGKLGPQTIAAIRRFESRTGIARTGKVTSSLLQRLEALNS